MKITKLIQWPLLGILLGSVYACEGFLDAKPEVSVSTPETLQDLRALLDDEDRINWYFPGLIEMATDDYFVPYNIYSSRTAFDQAIYRWDQEPLYLPADMTYWLRPYGAIAVANIVLESLERIQGGQSTLRNQLEGEALFVRGYAFLCLAQLFCPTYSSREESNELGLPLRLTSNFNEKSIRSTVQQTYNQIIDDLSQATELLPEIADVQTRASKAAAYAVLARTYLSMEEYGLAKQMADQVLIRKDDLIDLNQLNADATFPFPQMHAETIYYAFGINASGLLSPSRLNVSESLYESYDEDDLRKRVYFYDRGNGYTGFKGNYAGNASVFFAGLATDEMVLIRAECNARVGQVAEAIADLDRLLINRWKTGTYQPISPDDDVLRLILEERRKELPFRGVRWSDLKRLNKDERFATELVRIMDDGTTIETYTLPPNDPRYVFLIPQEVILQTGIQQNPR